MQLKVPRRQIWEINGMLNRVLTHLKVIPNPIFERLRNSPERCIPFIYHNNEELSFPYLHYNPTASMQQFGHDPSTEYCTQPKETQNYQDSAAVFPENHLPPNLNEDNAQNTEGQVVALVIYSYSRLNNTQLCLTLKTSITKEKVKFLVHTGADISVISANTLSNLPPPINSITIKGISNEVVNTQGIVTGNLIFNETLLIPHEFHIVERIPSDNFSGILGLDFLIKHDVLINLRKKMLMFSRRGCSGFITPIAEW